MPPENKADKLGSCTKDVNAYAHGRDGKRFIFVDTPGFNSSQSQLQVLKKIAVWLATTCAPSFSAEKFAHHSTDGEAPLNLQASFTRVA